jgi:hypothetical protein
MKNMKKNCAWGLPCRAPPLHRAPQLALRLGPECGKGWGRSPQRPLKHPLPPWPPPSPPHPHNPMLCPHPPSARSQHERQHCGG